MTFDSVVNLTVGKLSELLIQEAKFLYGVEGEVNNIRNELMMINSFLVDMEASDDEVGDERVRTTAKQLREIAYDAEDAIESFILEATPAQAKKDFLHKYLCFCKCLAKTHIVGTEIQAITDRISRTMDSLKRYGGENGMTKAVGGSRNKHKVWKPTAYSYTKEDHIVGLAEDINKLVSSLTTNVEVKIRMASIVGMGGSGKTTLAREVYNHENVKQCFQSMAWVSVSQQWNSQLMFHDILRKVSGDIVKLDEERTLMYVKDEIQEYLTARKYLIVFDDVWTKEALEEILPILPPGIEGSKIVVTTRFREVVDYPGLKISIHEPRGLTEEESWELFSKIALGPEREQNTSSMELNSMKELAKEMLAKCKGLPLAVVAVAGILAKKETLEEWELVKKAMSSMVMEVGRGTHSYGAVKHMLALSYNDLPCEIKPCFLHLCVFPEDVEIPTGMLIRMWIAEGFVSSNNIHHEGQTLEDLARGYLDELVGRCVVRVVSRNYEGKPNRIEIHDLMRDLCIQKAKELNFLEILSCGSPNPSVMDTQPRRIAISSYDKNYSPLSVGDWHLRSLYAVGNFNWRDLRGLSLKPIANRFKLLRVLYLFSIRSPDGKLPSNIGSLIHLRIFGLRDTNITQLPNTIGNLRNLLTLEVRDEEFTNDMIPDVLWKMEMLRHIYLNWYQKMNNKFRFDTLTHLQTLSVGGGEWMMEELPKLSKTVKKLKILGITTTAQIDVAFQCPSIKSDCLQDLLLVWKIKKKGSITQRHLEQLAGCRHLRRLALGGRIDERLDCFHFPAGIKKLMLGKSKLRLEETIAALGSLPNLSVLVLEEAYLGTKWVCGEGTFPQLKELSIFLLPNLVEWSIAETAMPRLQKLSLDWCFSLPRLPEGVEFITTLKHLELIRMSDEFCETIKGPNAPDAHIIKHIPKVEYRDS